MLRYFLLLLCIVACVLSFSGRRVMTAADERYGLKMERSFRQAEYMADHAAMLARANEILYYFNQFIIDDHIYNIQLHAQLQRGEVYCAMGQRKQAEADFDAVIAKSSSLPIKLKAFRCKMMAARLPGKQQYARLNNYGKAILKLFRKIKKTEWFKTDQEKAAFSLFLYGEAVHLWCVSLLEQKQYDMAKKIYFDYLAEYKDDTEFQKIFDGAPYIYYGLVRIYRKEKDFVREEYYLKRCLASISIKNYAYAGMFLRAAGYAIREGNFDRAIKYCDTGLAWGMKQRFPSKEDEQGYYEMLWAGKREIYQQMNQPEKAEECSRRIKSKLDSDELDKLRHLLFVF